MGRPSKFTAATRERILQAKRVGASDRTASRVAGISPPTLRDWLSKGEKGSPESQYRRFWEEFEEAAAHPRERALGIIYNALPDRPDLAWKYIERREDGYAPPVPTTAAAQAGPVSITLSFFETQGPGSSSEVIAGEVVDERGAGEPQTQPAELARRASREPA